MLSLVDQVRGNENFWISRVTLKNSFDSWAERCFKYIRNGRAKLNISLISLDLEIMIKNPFAERDFKYNKIVTFCFPKSWSKTFFFRSLQWLEKLSSRRLNPLQEKWAICTVQSLYNAILGIWIRTVFLTDGNSIVLFDSLRPINNLSVIKRRVFLGWTSTKLGLMFLLKDTTQWRWWGSNPQPLGLESSTLPLRSLLY